MNEQKITDQDVWNRFMELQSALQLAKPNDRSSIVRAYAVTLTEVEKALAYFRTFVLAPQDEIGRQP